MVLVAVVTLDGNNEALPLAWGIIPGESEETWSWFLGHLRAAFLAMASPGLVMIIHRDKGLESAREHHFPHAYHAHCCQLLAAIVQSYFGQACKKHFSKAAYATAESVFKAAELDVDNTLSRFQRTDRQHMPFQA